MPPTPHRNPVPVQSPEPALNKAHDHFHRDNSACADTGHRTILNEYAIVLGEVAVTHHRQRHDFAGLCLAAKACLCEWQIGGDDQYGRIRVLVRFFVKLFGGRRADTGIKAGHDVKQLLLAPEIGQRDIIQITVYQGKVRHGIALSGQIARANRHWYLLYFLLV